MAIFRAMGASPSTIFRLLVLEAAITAAVGAILGACFLYVGLLVAQPIIDAAFGLYLPIDPPSGLEATVFVSVIVASAIVSALPAYRAYRLSLVDGMTVKS